MSGEIIGKPHAAERVIARSRGPPDAADAIVTSPADAQGPVETGPAGLETSTWEAAVVAAPATRNRPVALGVEPRGVRAKQPERFRDGRLRTWIPIIGGSTVTAG